MPTADDDEEKQIPGVVVERSFGIPKDPVYVPTPPAKDLQTSKPSRLLHTITSESSVISESINSIISPKNVAFLQNRNKNNSVLGKVKKDDSRFDFDGSLILDIDTISGSFAEYLLACNDKTAIIDMNDLVGMFNMTINTFLETKLISNKKSQLLDKSLYHHQFLPELPGYSLREVCELYRSEFINQRVIAMRIITGILTRRDFVTALRAYHHDESKLFSTDMMNFSTCCASFRLLVTKCISVGLKQSVVVDSTETFLLTHCVATVIPANLPSLIVWGMQFKNVMCRYASMHCIHAYICGSLVESSASELLWSGFWGTFGVPALLTLHTKRGTNVSYEVHFQTCLAKVSSILGQSDDSAAANNENEGEEEEDDDDNKSDSFSLSCRWNRVDALVQETSLVRLFVSTIEDTVMQLNSRYKKVNSEINVNSFSGLDMGCSFLALDCLCVLAESCSESNMNVLHSCVFLSPTANLVTNIFDLTVLLHATPCVSVKFFLAEWLRLTVLMCRNCYLSAKFVFNQCSEIVTRVIKSVICSTSFANIVELEADNSHSKTASEIKNSTALVRWTVRLLRLGLVYGFGLEIVGDLLKLSLNQSCWLFSDIAFKPVMSSYCCNRRGELVSMDVEIFWLLEQAAVTCAFCITKMEKFAAALLSCIDNLLSLVSIILKDMVAAVGVETEDDVETNGSLLESSRLHFLCSVIGIVERHDTMKNSCTADHLTTALLEASSVRGIGLIPSILKNVAELTVGAQQNSCMKRFETLCTQILAVFTVWTRSIALSRIIAVNAKLRLCNTGDNNWIREEVALALLRLLLCCCHILPDGIIRSAVLDDVMRHDSAKVKLPPSVSDGIISWHIYRLTQISILLRLRLRMSVLEYNSYEIRVNLHKIISCFSDSMSGGTVLLLRNLLGSWFESCGYSIDINNNSVNGQQSIGFLADMILKSLLNISMTSTAAVNSNDQFYTLQCTGVAPMDVLYGSCVGLNKSVGSSGVSNWKSLCFTGQLPLPELWEYVILDRLHGSELQIWLKTLRIINHSVVAGGECLDQHSQLSGKLYYLLRLATPQFVSLWFDDTHFDIETVDYCSLLVELSNRIILCDHQKFRSSLNSISRAKSFSTDTYSHSSRTNNHVGGVIRLCDELLDCGLGQNISHDVHCAVFRVLVSPFMPWVIREKVWRTVGELRLLHLLEYNMIQDDKLWYNMFNVTPSVTRGELNVCLSILTAVRSLRCADDRCFSIVTSGLIQITTFIFSYDGHLECGTHEENPMNNLSWCLFNEVFCCDAVLSELNTYFDWVTDSILMIAEKCRLCSLNEGKIFTDTVRQHWMRNRLSWQAVLTSELYSKIEKVVNCNFKF